jgi:SAM-dependent methyltransferase
MWWALIPAWEGVWWLRRRMRRTAQFQRARAEADRLGRPLVVIGAPDGGVTAGYGCGDVTVDLAPSYCPTSIRADVTKPLPFKNNSVVVFCSCVLEYVTDPLSAIAEIQRISGGHSFFTGVEPWTLTAYLYPGAKQTLPATYR